jgi:hypothetical protein
VTEDFEFYETPRTFAHWLFEEIDVRGRVFEPCVGEPRHSRSPLAAEWYALVHQRSGPTLPADVHKDARDRTLWEAHEFDWTISNPPFTPAIDIITHALRYSRVGVAMHLRASIHEVLKTGVRRTWMREHTPTGILWLPRFAYQRSKTTGKWTTDSVCACWVIWLRDPHAPQFIKYAPEWVIDDLDRETPDYRRRMDALMAKRRESPLSDDAVDPQVASTGKLSTRE